MIIEGTRNNAARQPGARNEAEQRMNSSDIDDPYLWLEELASSDVRAWIAERNAETLGALADARFEADRSGVLDLLNADDRIPQIGRRGSFVYNFWKDGAHPKGIWRRTTLAEYRNKEPAWDVLLDVDALARAEGEDWVWQGCDALPPDYRRGLVRLSRGGADANVTREFDLETRRFLDDGFKLPEAKTSAAWMDEDRLLVATPLGGEEFATQSGYARTVRLWRRGTPFIEAPIVFEGERSDVYIYAWQAHEAPRPVGTNPSGTEAVAGWPRAPTAGRRWGCPRPARRPPVPWGATVRRRSPALREPGERRQVCDRVR